LVIGQQATGVNAFLGYAATLFKEILGGSYFSILETCGKFARH